MPILYTPPVDGPSLTQYLKHQWLDKRQKNHLRTRNLQVRPYAHPERNSGAYVHIPENWRKNKLAPKSELMVYIRHTEGVKTY